MKSENPTDDSSRDARETDPEKKAELLYWSERFGITPEDLEGAVAGMGPESVRDVDHPGK